MVSSLLKGWGLKIVFGLTVILLDCLINYYNSRKTNNSDTAPNKLDYYLYFKFLIHTQLESTKDFKFKQAKLLPSPPHIIANDTTPTGDSRQKMTAQKIKTKT